ncbi:MAG: eCIS core domain-containing protein, partial [Armatimonadota bacterium]
MFGLRDVTSNIDPDLIAAIDEFFGEDSSSVRYIQIRSGSLADLIARIWSPRARAFAWKRTVLFPAGREAIWREPWREENARTIAHELW